MFVKKGTNTLKKKISETLFKYSIISTSRGLTKFQNYTFAIFKTQSTLKNFKY